MGQDVRQGHRKACRVRSRDQLFWIRTWTVLEARFIRVSPLMVSPAVKVPVPVGTSPVHSALPFAGIAASSSSLRPRVTPQSTPPQLADWFGQTTLGWSYSNLFVANSHSLKCQRAQRDY